MCQTHRPFLPPLSSICKGYSVDLNEATICAALWRSFDTSTLLICQLLIGTTPDFVLSIVCCTSQYPKSKTLSCLCVCHHIIPLLVLKDFLTEKRTLLRFIPSQASNAKMFYLRIWSEKSSCNNKWFFVRIIFSTTFTEDGTLFLRFSMELRSNVLMKTTSKQKQIKFQIKTNKIPKKCFQFTLDRKDRQ